VFGRPDLEPLPSIPPSYNALVYSGIGTNTWSKQLGFPLSYMMQPRGKIQSDLVSSAHSGRSTPVGDKSMPGDTHKETTLGYNRPLYNHFPLLWPRPPSPPERPVNRRRRLLRLHRPLPVEPRCFPRDPSVLGFASSPSPSSPRRMPRWTRKLVFVEGNLYFMLGRSFVDLLVLSLHLAPWVPVLLCKMLFSHSDTTVQAIPKRMRNETRVCKS
jgi:hypothetical protein